MNKSKNQNLTITTSLHLLLTHGYQKPDLLYVLWGQPIKLIQVVSTSEFHEY